MAVHPRRLDEAHDRCSSLASAQATRKQPIAAADRNRSNLVLDPIVVHWQTPIVNESGECRPTPQAVVQGPGGGRTVQQLLPLESHPLVKRVQHRFALLLPGCPSLVNTHCLDLLLDLVDRGELIERKLGELALVGRMQVKELAPGMCQAADLGDA